MKIITIDDLIPLTHLDILRIKSASKKNIGIILSKLISHDRDLEDENLEMLDVDYGENENT